MMEFLSASADLNTENPSVQEVISHYKQLSAKDGYLVKREGMKINAVTVSPSLKLLLDGISYFYYYLFECNVNVPLSSPPTK